MSYESVHTANLSHAVLLATADGAKHDGWYAAALRPPCLSPPLLACPRCPRCPLSFGVALGHHSPCSNCGNAPRTLLAPITSDCVLLKHRRRWSLESVSGIECDKVAAPIKRSAGNAARTGVAGACGGTEAGQEQQEQEQEQRQRQSVS